MIKSALKYLEPNAAIPIDMETTIMLVNALKEALAQRTEQETDELQSLRQFRDAAFLAHPNIDLDIEAAHGIKEDT